MNPWALLRAPTFALPPPPPSKLSVLHFLSGTHLPFRNRTHFLSSPNSLPLHQRPISKVPPPSLSVNSHRAHILVRVPHLPGLGLAPPVDSEAMTRDWPMSPEPPADGRWSDVRVVRFGGPLIEMEQVGDAEDGDVVVETCITRTLPPALTLEQGLESIKKAIEKLKLDPPGSTSGMLRFQ
ncbi:hypothetical protein CRG98_026474, partial [Punica granatum]